MILVGTTTEVLPIVQIDDDADRVRAARPVAGRLWDAYRQEVERWLAGHSSTA